MNDKKKNTPDRVRSKKKIPFGEVHTDKDGNVTIHNSFDKMEEITERVIALLEENGCTVAEANQILDHVRWEVSCRSKVCARR